MILENIQLPELKNKFFDTTGIDSYEYCFDKEYFKHYPYEISYQYNNRGFRDIEWPEDLHNCIWCIGDSFTVGLGSPFEYTWPQVLQKDINSRVINVSLNGASNQWISKTAIQIIKEVNPKNIVIMWSYTHRRELNNSNKTDMERRVWFDLGTTEIEDFINFKFCINEVNKIKHDVIHLMIPKAFSKKDKLNYEFDTIKNYLGEVRVLDYARDSYHFDIKTSEQISKQIIPLLTT